MTPPWDELGIEPTQDVAAIRQAYAIRLKTVRPDDDPAGFQRLRAAYESALTLASAKKVAASVQRIAPDGGIVSASPDEAAPASTGPQWPSEVQREIDRLKRAFATEDGESAAAAMATALGLQTLPIEIEIQAVDTLIGILLKDKVIAPERLLEIAQRFGWYGVPDKLRGKTGWSERRLCQRIDAELWLKQTRAQTRGWRFWIGHNTATAAKLVLGDGPILLSRIAPPLPQVSNLAAQALTFAHQLDGAIDVKRINKIAGILKIHSKIQPLFKIINYIIGFFSFMLIFLHSMPGIPHFLLLVPLFYVLYNLRYRSEVFRTPFGIFIALDIYRPGFCFHSMTGASGSLPAQHRQANLGTLGSKPPISLSVWAMISASSWPIGRRMNLEIPTSI